MNILVLIAVATASYFIMIVYQRGTGCDKNVQNYVALAVCSLLAWWNICDAFFYVAATKEQAWMWHHIGAVGWCGFIAMTAYFFLEMSGVTHRFNGLIWQIIYWLPPILLTGCFVFSNISPMAEDLVQSRSGLGWAYVQTYNSPWPFIFLGYLVLYLGGALAYLLLWQRDQQQDSYKKLAKGFVVVDCIAVMVGFISIFILPIFTELLPPLSCIATLIFGISYWDALRDYDLMNIEIALKPGSLFESCMDAVLITDIDYRILYANDEAKRILAETAPKGLFFTEDFMSLEEQNQFIASMHCSTDVNNLNLELVNGVPIICSVKPAQTRRRNMDIYIISMHDICELKAAQDRLNYLAYFDELTGLPNRRSLNRTVEQYVDIYHTSKEDFEILFLDINGFKFINDNYGHEAGDKALKAVAGVIGEMENISVMPSRLAGDEFIIVNRNLQKFIDVEQLKDRISTLDISSFATDAKISVSVGVCKFSEAGDILNLFKIADDRMYQDKQEYYQVNEIHQ